MWPRGGCEVSESLGKAVDKWKGVVNRLGKLASVIMVLLWRDSDARSEEKRKGEARRTGISWIVELGREISWIRMRIHKSVRDSPERPVLLHSVSCTGHSRGQVTWGAGGGY